LFLAELGLGPSWLGRARQGYDIIDLIKVMAFCGTVREAVAVAGTVVYGRYDKLNYGSQVCFSRVRLPWIGRSGLVLSCLVPSWFEFRLKGRPPGM